MTTPPTSDTKWPQNLVAELLAGNQFDMPETIREEMRVRPDASPPELAREFMSALATNREQERAVIYELIRNEIAQVRAPIGHQSEHK